MILNSSQIHSAATSGAPSIAGLGVALDSCRAMFGAPTNTFGARTATSASQCSAFTLIELIISASLMTLVLGAAYACLRSGLAGRALIETRADALQGARVALTLLTADLRAACPLSNDIEFLGMKRNLGGMEADNLDFGTHNYTPRREREGDFCEVSYYIEPDPQTEEFVLWRRRDSSPDDKPLEGGAREEIVRGVRGFQLEYFDGFEWFDEWGDPNGRKTKGQGSLLISPNLAGLPEAVRITLSVEPSTKKKSTTTADEKSSEPPMVLQTVARLNLAAMSLTTQSSGSATNRASSGPASGTGEFPGIGGPR